jgi:hypothetical protein
MLDEELRESPFPTTWDNTMRATAGTCKRKFYWFLRGYDYAGRPPYFTWGSAFQEILVEWYLSKEPPDVAIEQALNKGLAFYDKEIGEAEPNVDNSRNNLTHIWINYVSEHPAEPWEMIPGGAEAGWVWPIEGTDYFMGGSLDGRIDWPPYGALVLETKTTSEYLSDAFCARWSFSGQVTGYIWYLTQVLGDEVYGCLMNLVTKKKPGPKSKWTTPRTARPLVRKSPEQLREFREEFLWDVEEVRECWANWFWPKTSDPTNCTGGAGKAPCLFKNVCLVDKMDYRKLDAEQHRGIKLRKGPWEPWLRGGSQNGD